MDESHGILVLVDPVNPGETAVRDAGRLAVETGLPVVLLAVVTPLEYERRRRALAAIGQLSDFEYSLDQALEGARHRADRLGLDELSPLGVEYTTVVKYVGREERLSGFAASFEHVVLTVTPRRWLRRRLRPSAVGRALVEGFEGELTLVAG
jgi:hypothetical protein